MEAKQELSTYKWKLIEITRLNTKIDSLSIILGGFTSSIIKVMTENSKELTEKHAELYDLQMQVINKRLEAERYNNQIEDRIAGLKI